ncbi:MAG TPA: histidine phosphatase family protein [Nitrosospira sp.]
MELILWRHAEAEDGIPDSARKLTPHGLKQAQAVAEWLTPRLPKSVQIIASPTRRTRQTAEALAAKFEIAEEIGPGASAKTILAVAQWPDAKGTVVIVGHQPTLGETSALILCGEPVEWNMKKGAVWWFSHKEKDGAAVANLRASISPDMLFK